MVQYHFKLSDGPDLGPIGAEEFRQRQEAGEITDETMVWRSGMVDWTTYGNLRAAEVLAAQSGPKAPPPLPRKRAAAAAAAAASAALPKAGFLACGMCAKEWPESLLTLEDGQKICGNCLNKKKQDKKDGKSKAGPSSGMGAWFLMILAIVCAGCLAYKVYHYGVRLPKGKATELTAPSTFGGK